MTHTIKNNKNIKLYIFSFLISFVILLFCTKNSPLYPFNNWVDENAFFTVGKAWTHGIVPYRNIFEQKGPLLYFIFMLGSIISKKSFIGIFVFEVISLTITLIFSCKIIQLFLKDKFIYPILPLLASIICSSGFFVHGGSVEEFCFPFLFISLYYFLKHFINSKISYIELFINGFIAGCVSMMKFNLLGFWFIFMAAIFFDFIFSKEIKKAFISCVVFLAGMMLPIGIFSIYFLSVHGFRDFINTYIMYNAFSYSVKIPIFERIVKVFTILYKQVTINFIIFNLIYLGLLYFALNKKIIKNNICKISLILMFVFSGLGIYWGTLDFKYYFLFLTSFIIIGLIAFYYYVYGNKDIKGRKFVLNIIFSIIVSIVFIANSSNLDYMKKSKNNLVQYKFAEEINKTKNATLLNYGFLDGGFYFAADVLPNTKYFEKQNMPVEGCDATLLTEITQKKFDYIVTRSYVAFDPVNKEIKDNYDLIDEVKETTEGIEFKYSLFKRNDL